MMTPHTPLASTQSGSNATPGALNGLFHPPTRMTPEQVDDHLIACAGSEMQNLALRTSMVSIPIFELPQFFHEQIRQDFIHLNPSGAVKFLRFELSIKTYLEALEDAHQGKRGELPSLAHILNILEHSGLSGLHLRSDNSRRDLLTSTTSISLPGSAAMRALIDLRFKHNPVSLYDSYGITPPGTIREDVRCSRWPLALIIPGEESLENPDGLKTGPYGTAFHDFYHAWRQSSHPVETRMEAVHLAEKLETFAKGLRDMQGDEFRTLMNNARNSKFFPDIPSYSTWGRLVSTSECDPACSYRQVLIDCIGSASESLVELDIMPTGANLSQRRIVESGFGVDHPENLQAKFPFFLNALAYAMSAQALGLSAAEQ